MDINLGNVVGLLRSLTPPASKPYLLWGKILDSQNPFVVELRVYSGSGDPALEANWQPVDGSTPAGNVEVAWVDVTEKPTLLEAVDVSTGALRFRGTDNTGAVVTIAAITISTILEAQETTYLDTYNAALV